MLRTTIPAFLFLLFFSLINSNLSISQSFLQINSSSISDVYQVKSMENNDLIVRGNYRGTAQFGSIKKYSKDKVTFIARVTPTGAFLWVTELDVVIADMAVTQDGIWALSVFKTKNKEAKTSSSEMSLIKYNFNGQKQSKKSICKLTGSLYDPYLRGVLNKKGQPLACAHWVKNATTKLNGKTLKKNKFGAICYVQYDHDGNEIWRQNTEAGEGSFTDMHIDAMNFDAANNFYVVGEYGEEAIFNSKTLTTELAFAKGSGSINLYFKGSFLLKINPKGAIEKVEAISKYQCEYTAIAFNENDDVFLGGYFKGTRDREKEPIPIVGGKELLGESPMNGTSFIVALNSDWQAIWNYSLESERENRVSSMTVANNRLITTGFWKKKLFDGKTTFTSTETAAPYKSEAYQQSFDVQGTHLNTVVYQGKESEWPKHILNASQQMVTYGSFRDEINIGNSKFTSKGTYQNAFIILPKKLTNNDMPNSGKGSETSENAPPTNNGKYKKGQHVLANWKNKGKFYGCIITQIEGNKVTLMYDDNDTETTTTDFLKQDWIVGDIVECNWKAKGTYYKCTIESINGDKYKVLYSDGQNETTTSGFLRSN
jgi:hypothetical protein